MAAQRITEWLETPKHEYHQRQLNEVYRSTVHMCDWLTANGYISEDSRHSVLDLGTGAGANLIYMGKRFPHCKFIGLDLNQGHVDTANRELIGRGVTNAMAMQGDWYRLMDDFKFAGKFDGIISYQTLSWLPDFREPLSIMCRCRPKWIAVSSLFYDGPVSSITDTQTYDDDLNPVRNLYYNVYSIPVIKKHLKNEGYVKFNCKKFEIDVDIPPDGTFRTYTERTVDGRRIQISGPVYMPWYFISAERGVE